MTLLTKLLIAAGLLSALAGAAYTWQHAAYKDGVRDGQTQVRKEIADARAEADRLNKTIVRKDQALIVAKTEDKAKIVTIYKTIRSQLDAKIIEVPVYRTTDCDVPADGLRLIAAAASGRDMRADPSSAASHPASRTTDAKK